MFVSFHRKKQLCSSFDFQKSELRWRSCKPNLWDFTVHEFHACAKFWKFKKTRAWANYPNNKRSFLQLWGFHLLAPVGRILRRVGSLREILERRMRYSLLLITVFQKSLRSWLWQMGNFAAVLRYSPKTTRIKTRAGAVQFSGKEFESHKWFFPSR